MNKFKITFLILITITLCLNAPISCYALEKTAYVWSPQESTYEASSNLSSNLEIEENNFLNLESGSAILIEQTTGQILYSHNIHEQLRPASVTKIMSLLLIMRQIQSGKLNLTDQIPCSEKAANMGGSQIWLDTTETLSVDEMLKAICVNSANDCVYAMAEHIAGSEEGFVDMMNQTATELGMNDTTFKNCHGLDEDGHVTSANDIALMSRELLNNYPEIKNYTSIWMDSLRDGKSELVNTNKLIRNYKGATGLKTGSTSQALFNLSASATRDDLSLIAVIMKGPTSQIRFDEAKKLLDYGFANFSFRQIAKKGDFLNEVEIKKGIIPIVNAIFENDCGILTEKGQETNIVQNIYFDENISAPIQAGQKIGTVTFTLNDKVISTCDLVAGESIDKINLFTMSKKICWKWLSCLRS